MHKEVSMPARPHPDRIARQPHTRILQRGKSFIQPIHPQRHMVQTLATLRHKSPNRGILRQGLQQFDPALAHRQHRRLHLLMRHRLLMGHTHPEHLVKTPRLRDVLHRNPQMIQLQRTASIFCCDHTAIPATIRPAPHPTPMQSILAIGGKQVRLDIYEPNTPGPHPAILLLHGAGGNAEYWLDRLTPAIARAGIAVYAVHYFDRTDTVRADLRMFSDGVHIPLWLDTIRQTLAHIAARPTVDLKRIALVGISLGAFLSLALATMPETTPVKAIVEISGGLVPPYEDSSTPSFPPTLILHGDADTVVTVAHAHNLDARLTSLNVPHETHILRGETHWFTGAAQLRIFAATADFLTRHL